jgi:hypothetical protein
MQDECQLPKITRNGNVSSYGYKPFGDESTRTKTFKKKLQVKNLIILNT